MEREFNDTLDKQLNERDDYVVLKITFEEIDPDFYQEQGYIHELLMMMLDRLEFLSLAEPASFIEQHIEQVTTFPALSRFVTRFVRDMMPGKSVVLLIDEVDKSSGSQLFLTFLRMLRNKYLKRNEGQDHTFHSVILAGVHDIKTLKSEIRPDDERTYNSPWNIAADFRVDMSLAPHEIESMLEDYTREKNIKPDIPGIVEKLHYYTSGYPWLVSKLCKFIDEDIVPQREEKNWSAGDVDTAFRMITNEGYTTTLFDSLAKNLENSRKLYDLISRIAISGASFPFNITNPVINLGLMYGILVPSEQGRMSE